MSKLGKKLIKAVKECAKKEISLCLYCTEIRGATSVGMCEICGDEGVTIISKSEMKRRAHLKGKKK
jgi:recombinational DNA repair protein RecR